MSFIPRDEPNFRYSKTKQSFKDSCDINKIMARYQKTGAISHLSKFGAEYGDFDPSLDLLSAHNLIARGDEIFSELPSEVRREFGNNAFDFFTFVNDPANKDRLAELLPQLAAPGRQLASLPQPDAGKTESNTQPSGAVPDSGDDSPPGSGDDA